jgi:energy-coupling factor transporter ATP-binding protein EcfA2
MQQHNEESPPDFLDEKKKKPLGIILDFQEGYKTPAEFFSAFLASDKQVNDVLAAVHESLGFKDVLSQFAFRETQLFMIMGGTSFILFNDACLPIAVFTYNVRVSPDKADETVLSGYRYIGPKDLMDTVIYPALIACLGDPPIVYPNVRTIEDISLYGQFSLSKEKFLTDEPGIQYARQEFYPWMTQGIQEYFDDFFISTENVLILVGPPGTGKSTLLRTGLKLARANAWIAYKTSVITDKHFMQGCQQFMSEARAKDYCDFDKRYLLEDKGSLEIRRKAIVLEDADILLGKRTNGNPAMSEILNVTNGIASSPNTKFIFSTNIDDIDDIDPALLRPGRCFDILHFGSLTASQARKVRQLEDLSEVDFSESRTYKLTEVLNRLGLEQRAEPIVSPRFGFNK